MALNSHNYHLNVIDMAFYLDVITMDIITSALAVLSLLQVMPNQFLIDK